MSRGDNRRGQKKYRVRYDRIVVLALVIITIAVLISSCVNGIRGKKNIGSVPELSKNITTAAKNTQTTTEAAETEANPQNSEKTTETATTVAGSTVSVASDDVHKGDLILVNADYEYTFPEGDIEPITIIENKNDFYDAGDYVTKLDKEVVIQLNALMEAYAVSKNTDDTDIFVQDGFRTYDEQVVRHSTGKSKTFEAGHVDYHTGRTFDMFLMDSTSSSGYAYFTADEWFNQNAGSYGFILRYPEGKKEKTGENPRCYTYRYVGIPHASYINFNQLCLEEYIEEVKRHTNDNPLEITAGGNTYNVYYVPAEESGNTDVPVPDDKPYTISGCNAGGFIVTVTIS